MQIYLPLVTVHPHRIRKRWPRQVRPIVVLSYDINNAVSFFFSFVRQLPKPVCSNGTLINSWLVGRWTVLMMVTPHVHWLRATIHALWPNSTTNWTQWKHSHFDKMSSDTACFWWKNICFQNFIGVWWSKVNGMDQKHSENCFHSWNSKRFQSELRWWACANS